MDIKLYWRELKIRFQRLLIKIVLSEHQRYNIEQSIKHNFNFLVELKSKERDFDKIDDIERNLNKLLYLLAVLRTKEWK